jgi:uncharacterized protein (TIGR03083 family)
MRSATFTSAAEAFARLVHGIPADRWDGPGLGDWDLRALVGHTSRSLITVMTYLDVPAEREDITSAHDYYVYAKAVVTGDPSGVVERGRQAGRELGPDPATAVDRLIDEAMRKLEAADDRLISVVGGMGIRLSVYLSTRIFELAVHTLDIAAALGIPLELPRDVLTEVTALAARVAVATGDGETVLMALTGRRALPPSFSVT